MLSSNKPYLLRAFYDWIVDNECTPYLLVDATVEGTEVPTAFIENGNIILNVAPHACASFVATNDAVSFSARFQGKVHQVYIPMSAVQAVYAKETGDGTMFEESMITSENEEHDEVSPVVTSELKGMLVEPSEDSEGSKSAAEKESNKPQKQKTRAQRGSHLTLVK